MGICLPLCRGSFVPNQSVRSQVPSNLRCALVDKSPVLGRKRGDTRLKLSLGFLRRSRLGYLHMLGPALRMRLHTATSIS